MVMVPYKSVAAALILVVLFGPIGLFYSSFLGGMVMSIFGLISIGAMASMHSPLPMATIYLASVIWAMASVRCYNRYLLDIVLKAAGKELLDKKATSKKASFFNRKKTNHAVSSAKADEATVETQEDDTSWKL